MKLSRALALSLCLASCAIAQNYGLAPVARQQFFSAAGKPLSGGKLYSYAAGTNTPQATYSSSAGAANANPLILDSGGFGSVWLGTSSYKLVLQDANGVQQWVQDNVSDLGLLASVKAGAAANWLVDATAYGAKHNGTTDDTGSIQAAITAAAGSGGTVYLPCGTYLLNQTNGIRISSANVNLLGAAESCVTLHHTGSGSAVTIQMSPFSTQTAGQYANFQIVGTSTGAAGLVTGCIVGANFSHIAVDGYTNGTGIDLQDRLDCNAGGGGGWTERTSWDNVWGGGLIVGGIGADNKWDWKFETVGGPTNTSFGYNRFLNVAANVHSGQIGYEFASGYVYNSHWISTCNLDDGAAYSTAPICIQIDGANVSQNWYQITGEYQGTHTAKSINHVTGGFWGYGSMNVLDQSGNPLAGTSAISNAQQAVARITALPEGQSWDTGAMTVNSTSTTPTIIASDHLGEVNFGYSIGTNIASPWISMLATGGNHFMICQLNSGVSIANCPVGANRLFDVASSTGAVSIPGGGNFFTYGASVAPLQVGGMTSGGTTAGYQSAAFTPLSSGTGTGQINESLAVGIGGQAGLGDSEGTNVSHPILFGYSGDSVDLEVYEKGFRVPISGSPVLRVLHSGNLEPGQHLIQPSSGHDIAGTCALSAATACSLTFTHAFGSAPLCSATPAFDPGVGVRFWISSSSASACQVTFSAAVTGSVTIMAVGNPN